MQSVYIKNTSDSEEVPQIKMDPVQPFQLFFKNLNVTADVDQVVTLENSQDKTITVQKKILNNCEGIFSPGTFTAIVGPSGCGKTTLLNLLSGRLLSTNLKLQGQLYVNGKLTNDINQHGQKIGYVMQQDLLFPTFTPRQTFMFIANLRLPGLSEQQKKQHVQQMIVSLGLQKCSDTFVGNEIIRGVSGGEKKRTSIGVEILINPSIIFLDEPTTGLDSTTALHVVQTLNKLANTGRTIIATIHQPSSQIFTSFDKLILMVQGNFVYQGNCMDSINYFKKIGYPVPSRTNPTDFYMKIMNKEGVALDYIEKGIQNISDQQVMKQFEGRIQHFKNSYKQQNVKLTSKITDELVSSDTQNYWCSQMGHIFVRAVWNEIRNPLDVRMKIISNLVQAIFCVILYYQQGSTAFAKIQNSSGALFFMLMNAGFGAISGALSSFSLERPIFIRQRMSNSYSTSAYFWGRSFATFPLDIFLPLFFIAICYFACNLSNDAATFFWALLVLQLVYWHSASYGLFISTLFKDISTAMAIIPLLLIPLMLLAGFFMNLNDTPKVFYAIAYISPFKYGFQALMQNEYKNPVDCGNGIECNLIDTRYQFPQPYWLDFVLLACIGIAFRVAAWVSLYVISNPKRVVLDNPPAKSYDESSNVQLIPLQIEGPNKIKLQQM